MTDIIWKDDRKTYSDVNRAETAELDGHALVVLDLPSPAYEANFIKWQVFGPPNGMILIVEREANTFDEGKAKAVEALERITNSGRKPE